MSTTESALDRPRRWDRAFSDDMNAESVARLLAFAPFKDMNPASFPRSAPLADILKNDARILRFKRGEIIVREGDYGTSAFMILAGGAEVVLGPGLPPSMVGRREPAKRGVLRALAQLWSNAREDEVVQPAERRGFLDGLRKSGDHEARVVLQDIPRVLDQYKTATMHAGDFFGEIAALSRMARTATIFAQQDNTELLEIRWQGLRDLMRYDPKLRQYIDGIYRERALASYLAEIPFMRFLSPEAKQRIVDATQFETYGEYDWSGDYKKLVESGASAAKDQIIAAEGDYPNSVIVVRSGFARLTQRYGDGHRTLNYLGSGQLYGFNEIAHNWQSTEDDQPLQFTLRVIGHTHVLVIPAAVIEEVVLPAIPKAQLPPPLALGDTRSRAPFATTPAAKTASKKNAEGRVPPELMEFLTENRFFNGTATMVIDNDRCTRCDDCVRACASTHDNNPRFLRHGPVHNNIMVAQACMHCADPVCMLGCPTGAIHRDAFGGDIVINPASCIGCSVCANNCPYTAIRMVEARDDTGEILVARDAKPLMKATKCDRCVDQYGGPACERACPHDALKRIDLNTLDEFVDWLKR
jgi:Fe-S-cluster-containing dehydrogenase component/CRP-like cAMP-binding protein